MPATLVLDATIDPCGFGKFDEARCFLHPPLKWEVGQRIWHGVLYAIAVIAHHLSDLGQIERAIELYALATRYPFVAYSRWFEDVAGKRIAKAAESLPPDVVATAQARGRARDLWETAEEIFVELEPLEGVE